MSRREFIHNLNIKTDNNSFLQYLPNDEFDFDEFVSKYFDGNYNDSSLRNILLYNSDNEYELKSFGFFPKQIKKIMDMRKNGEFDEYIKPKEVDYKLLQSLRGF